LSRDFEKFLPAAQFSCVGTPMQFFCDAEMLPFGSIGINWNYENIWKIVVISRENWMYVLLYSEPCVECRCEADGDFRAFTHRNYCAIAS
jgi:hypothetical protein